MQFVSDQENHAADSAYQQQYSAVKEAYPSLDLQQSDPETGQTLEYKILSFARENGLTNFEHATRLFANEQIMNSERERIREEVLQDLQKNRRLGVMGVSNEPTHPTSQADVRKMSQSEIMDAAANDPELWGET
jgi:hypothetical protein